MSQEGGGGSGSCSALAAAVLAESGTPPPRRTNASELISGDPEWDGRLYQCWRIQSCGACLGSSAGCGWCATSSTCLPLPSPRRPLRLLAPLSNPRICGDPSDRYELRTAGLGCAVSTRTFVTAFLTSLCTLAAVVVLIGAWKLGRWAVAAWTKMGNGVVLYGDGSWGVWKRSKQRWGWGSWKVWDWGRGGGRGGDGEATAGRRRWWGGWKMRGNGEEEERRRLLA
ncbi:hypothetical protein BDY21DRAFT_68575 [Lineolata rhizophorae]|uniref:PSI domain-containing protein n=1 Tax=Lineolata rhizophorae TaxID=578093 RepID=A0A6A6NWG4_9PEZI|nr:hypothetical protein BDY21DRAFT_68575 [Lineolata rhizophorae]